MGGKSWGNPASTLCQTQIRRAQDTPTVGVVSKGITVHGTWYQGWGERGAFDICLLLSHAGRFVGALRSPWQIIITAHLLFRGRNRVSERLSHLSQMVQPAAELGSTLQRKITSCISQKTENFYWRFLNKPCPKLEPLCVIEKLPVFFEFSPRKAVAGLPYKELESHNNNPINLVIKAGRSSFVTKQKRCAKG